MKARLALLLGLFIFIFLIYKEKRFILDHDLEAEKSKNIALPLLHFCSEPCAASAQGRKRKSKQMCVKERKGDQTLLVVNPFPRQSINPYTWLCPMTKSPLIRPHLLHCPIEDLNFQHRNVAVFQPLNHSTSPRLSLQGSASRGTPMMLYGTLGMEPGCMVQLSTSM
jgi:hypothetical protein